MSESCLSDLKIHFSELPDPRVQHSIEHLLIDIVMLTICAVICGAETWVEVENYGVAKQEWLETFLDLLCRVNYFWASRQLEQMLKPLQTLSDRISV